MIGVPSRLRLIRKTTTSERIFPTLDLNIEEKTSRRCWKNPRSDCDDRTPETTRRTRNNGLEVYTLHMGIESCYFCLL